jgi:hypothetical protein
MGFDSIIALNLGKFKSVARVTDAGIRRGAFEKPDTTPRRLHDLFPAHAAQPDPLRTFVECGNRPARGGGSGSGSSGSGGGSGTGCGTGSGTGSGIGCGFGCDIGGPNQIVSGTPTSRHAPREQLTATSHNKRHVVSMSVSRSSSSLSSTESVPPPP